MNIEQANRLGIVEYLSTLGQQPQKIRNYCHWYLSPLRVERTASFVVNQAKNVWFDHGIGKGGKLIDLVCMIQGCSISEALGKLYSLSFHPQKAPIEQPIAKESVISIIRAVTPIHDMNLVRYLHQRKIPKEIANQFCREVYFELNEKTFCAIGFQNDAGGYELRNARFKGSSSPKSPTFLDRGSGELVIFEGFFDFLGFQELAGQNKISPANIVVLNSLSFLERSITLMEKHRTIHLYLDNDPPGKRCVEELSKKPLNLIDESHLYKYHKDLNEWLIESQKQSQRLRPRL